MIMMHYTDILGINIFNATSVKKWAKSCEINEQAKSSLKCLAISTVYTSIIGRLITSVERLAAKC